MNRAIRLSKIVLLLIATVPSIALAQGAKLPQAIVPCNGVDCTVCHIATLAQNVVNTGIFIAVFLSAVLFAWAGVKFLTSQSSGGKGLGEAKQIFFNVMVGLVLILAAWLIVDSIVATLTGSHLWNKLC